MYRLLIVDDDMFVRMDLRSIINWDEYGIELMEDAANGMEALELIRQYKPHIVVLDLGMPLMNGLEVIKKLKSENFYGKIIVLSCHEDFDSVSEALKMGAADYLLKHTLKAENLAESINKTIQLLESENSERLQKERMEMLSGLSLKTLRENLVQDLVSGSLKSHEQIMEAASKLDIKIGLKKFVVALVEIDELYKLKEKYTKAEFNNLLKSAGDILEIALKGNEFIFGCMEEGVYCIVLDFDQAKSFMSINAKTFEICEKILEDIKSCLNLRASIGISRVCEDTGAVDECHTQAKLALEGKIYFGGNRIIHFSEAESYNRKLENFLSGYENEIICTVTEDGSSIDRCITGIFASLKEKHIKPEHIRVMCFELLMLANRTIKENNLGYTDVFGFEYLPYNYVINMETLADIEQWFIKVCHSINGAICSNGGKDTTKSYRPEIRKAIEYIGNYYMKNISLQEAADYSNLSRTYFSQVFKQETGENFIDYLNRFRIEKAMQLLKNSDMKVYAVGMECGFDNYRYFTKLFKEVCGVSPLEYRSGLNT